MPIRRKQDCRLILNNREATPLAERPTAVLAPDSAGMACAAMRLAQGCLVAFPTETVYGLGADATDANAVNDLFAAKARPRFNPLIVHVTTVPKARALAIFDAVAERLADRFWPGPLTLVLPLRPGSGLAPGISAGLPTLAVRVPDHPVAADLLARFGRPVAAPSANRSGRISPTSASDVMAELGGRIDAVIDGGPAPLGLESTVLAPRPDQRTIDLLRPGAIPREVVEEAVGGRLAVRNLQESLESSDRVTHPESPGQLASHYAPESDLRLNARAPTPDELFLGFGPTAGRCDESLSETGDLGEAAARLYAVLRRLDLLARRSGRSIAVARVPAQGLGYAINDRLRRAAAGRGSPEENANGLSD